MVDMDHLTLIPINKVPERVVYTPWPELFGKIPTGQALVIKEDQMNPDTMRAALIRLQSKKQFQYLEMQVRGPKGKRIAYVMNNTKRESGTA